MGAGWLLNPGEILGMKSTPSWAIYDGEQGTVAVREV
jgi:hypothetical protein